MRARLLGITLGLLTVLAVALGLPLVTGHAERVTEELFARRSADTRHLADATETALLTGRSTRLSAEMDRYKAVYGVSAVAVDVEQHEYSRSSGTLDLGPDIKFETLVRSALAGRSTDQFDVAWPWRADRPLVIAVPIIGEGQVIGAVVTTSPTSGPAADIRNRIAAVAGGGLGLLLLAALSVALPTVRWVLRPVLALDTATYEVAAGRPTRGVDEAAGAPELRRLAKSFNAISAQVRASLDQQRDFVSQASHQLRIPLTVLRLSVDNLSPHVDEAGRPYLELAAQETVRLGAVVDRLLELARAEASSAEQVRVDLVAAARARQAAWQDAYDAKGVALSLVELRPGQPSAALCDPETVAHALDSLFDNALKFCAGAPVCIEVGPSGTDPEALVEIAVTDCGPGISAAELDSVGSRFGAALRTRTWTGPGSASRPAASSSSRPAGACTSAPSSPAGCPTSTASTCAGACGASATSRSSR